MAATKVKGFFKGGFGHVRDIFAASKEEEEQEMQIGLPTDVKHVAHIGIDGGSSSVPQEKPGWMNEFHGDTKSTEQPEKKERAKGRSRPPPLRNYSSDENAQSDTQKSPKKKKKKKKRKKHRDSSGEKPSKKEGKRSSSDGDI